MSRRVLITGIAGFIGYHLASALVGAGWHVIGIDSLNRSYDKKLKKARLDKLYEKKNFTFIQGDLDRGDWVSGLSRYFDDVHHVVHLAAPAGVAHSRENPHGHLKASTVSHLNVLELCRQMPDFEHLVYASCASVYGAQTALPLRESMRTDKPLSLYGATKVSAERMSYAYSHLYGIPATALRLFTVYGPFGRPDMAYYQFAKAIRKARPIEIYDGAFTRDMTYVDDIVAGFIASLERPPQAEGDQPPHRVLNLGSANAVSSKDLLALIERLMGVKAQVTKIAPPPGHAPHTQADITLAAQQINFAPHVALEEGMKHFIDWFNNYHEKKD